MSGLGWPMGPAEESPLHRPWLGWPTPTVREQRHRHVAGGEAGDVIPPARVVDLSERPRGGDSTAALPKETGGGGAPGRGGAAGSAGEGSSDAGASDGRAQASMSAVGPRQGAARPSRVQSPAGRGTGDRSSVRQARRLRWEAALDVSRHREVSFVEAMAARALGFLGHDGGSRGSSDVWDLVDLEVVATGTREAPPRVPRNEGRVALVSRETWTLPGGAGTAAEDRQAQDDGAGEAPVGRARVGAADAEASRSERAGGSIQALDAVAGATGDGVIVDRLSRSDVRGAGLGWPPGHDVPTGVGAPPGSLGWPRDVGTGAETMLTEDVPQARAGEAGRDDGTAQSGSRGRIHGSGVRTDTAGDEDRSMSTRTGDEGRAQPSESGAQDRAQISTAGGAGGTRGQATASADRGVGGLVVSRDALLRGRSTPLEDASPGQQPDPTLSDSVAPSLPDPVVGWTSWRDVNRAATAVAVDAMTLDPMAAARRLLGGSVETRSGDAPSRRDDEPGTSGRDRPAPRPAANSDKPSPSASRTAAAPAPDPELPPAFEAERNPDVVAVQPPADSRTQPIRLPSRLSVGDLSVDTLVVSRETDDGCDGAPTSPAPVDTDVERPLPAPETPRSDRAPTARGPRIWGAGRDGDVEPTSVIGRWTPERADARREEGATTAASVTRSAQSGIVPLVHRSGPPQPVSRETSLPRPPSDTTRTQSGTPVTEALQKRQTSVESGVPAIDRSSTMHEVNDISEWPAVRSTGDFAGPGQPPPPVPAGVWYPPPGSPQPYDDDEQRKSLVGSLPLVDDSTPLAVQVAEDARRRISLVGKPFPPPPRTRILTVANQKGGVGKTTTTVNVAAAMAQAGLTVLVLDIDPQGNASTALGIDHHADIPSLYDVIVEGTPLADVLQPCPDVANLWCAPATIDLAGAEIELVSMVAREMRLQKALDAYLDERHEQGLPQIDYIFIDCPPSLSLLTINAFVAATEVFIPIQCEYYALEGLSQLLKHIDLIRGHLNPRLHVSTILLTMYDGRTRLSAQVADEVRAHFSDVVVRTTVPRSVRISEAPSHSQTVMTYDPASSGALSYLEASRELAEQVLHWGHEVTLEEHA